MSISKVGTYAFYNHPNLERAVVSAPTIEANAFQSSQKLEVVDLTSEAAVTINADAFSGCSNLTHLIVRSTARSSLSATSALDSTKIKRSDGGVYVPADLLDSYKGATNWSAFANNIFPIGEYPKANFDTISDSWATIFANTNYATDYAVKDTKTIELTDGTRIKMQLAAIDTDVKSDDSGTAKMTWLCRNPPFTHYYGISSSEYKWATSSLRTWLIENILPLIPSEVQGHIVSVYKTYLYGDTYTSVDAIWVPSAREVGYNYPSSMEASGVIYDKLFVVGTDATAKNSRSGYGSYWLRGNVDANNRAHIVMNSGDLTAATASTPYDVLFGFCTD